MLPNILKKISKNTFSIPVNTNTHSNNAGIISKQNNSNFTSLENVKLPVPNLKDPSELSITDLTIGNKQIPCFLGKEELACIPIISGGKWMGVIVTQEENQNPSTISINENLRNDQTEQTAHIIQRHPFHIGKFSSVSSDIQSIPVDKIRSILHEVNTPLSIIKNYLHILGDKLSKQHIAHDEIRIIQEEINRVSHLLASLNAPSVEHEEASRPVNINEQLIDLEKIIKEPLAKHSNVEIELDIENTLPPIYAKKDSIKQIFINLINNSLDAMPLGGHLHIRTQRIHNAKEGPNTDTRTSTDRLEITVSDTGTGIAPEVQSNIFQPFITSKKENHSGLGLSIVQDIVQSLHGTVTCTNNKEKGATFKITLPLSDSTLKKHEIPA